MVGKTKIKKSEDGKIIEIVHSDYSVDPDSIINPEAVKLMEDFKLTEAAQEFIINTHSEGFVKVTGTKLNDEYFARKEEGRILHSEARWLISDIKSGLVIPDIHAEGKGVALRFATLKDCKDWIKNIPEEYQEKLNRAKASESYAEACQKLAEFANSKE